MEVRTGRTCDASSSRIEWMDVFKGIMIILVVVGHATGKFNGWIYQFHMAAFFFASGYLSNVERKSDLSIVVKKILTILLPFFTLGVVGAILNGIINWSGEYELLFGSTFVGVGNTILEMFLFGKCYVQYWGTFWFLSTLFGIELLQIVLYQINGKKLNWRYFLVSLGLFFLGYWFVKNSIIPRFWIIELDLVFIGQLYFNVGLFMKKNNINDYLNRDKKCGAYIVLVIALIISWWGRNNGIAVDYPSRVFVHPFAECVVALSSIFIVYFISKFIADVIRPLKRIFSLIGKNSLGIMVLHFVFFKAFMFVLFEIGKATSDEITNVTMPTELSDIYWIPLTIVALVGSLLVWMGLCKIPGIRFLLGQDRMLNGKIQKMISNSRVATGSGLKVALAIEKFWNKVDFYVSKHKVFSISIVTLVILFSIPMFRTGIIINDELQARCLAMQGFATFYKTEFLAWMGQGRLLAAPINSFTKYLSFIGANAGTSFRIGSIIILLGVIVSFGIFIYKLLDDKYFATFSAVFALSCMPIAFEHTSPNAFVGFIALSFMLVLISNSMYISYLETQKGKYAIISMVLFFVAMMSYEAFITYTVLYLLVVFGKTGYRNIKKNITRYLIPITTALIFLACYVISGKVSPSGYEGNQLGFDSIDGPLEIISNLFVACVPGFYVFFPRYQYYKTIYYNLDVSDYIRIFLFAVVFVTICIAIIRKSNVIESSKKDNSLVEMGVGNNVFIILSGLSYMILPSLPNSIASMYQGIVGFNGSFLTLPVTFMEYFAAAFVFCYLVWLIIRKVGKKFYVIMIALICLLVVNIQQMNDIFSKEQENNFNRLLEIEKFLQTDTVRNLPMGEYYSADLYLQQNLLAIHNGYWTTYCNNVLGLEIQITAEHDGTEVGYIYYDGDNFVVVNSQTITVVSNDEETAPKAVQITDYDYVVFDFESPDAIVTTDADYHVYSIVNDGAVFSNVGYLPISGYNADGWIEKVSTYRVTTGEIGNIMGTLYYPGSNVEGKRIKMYLEDDEVLIIDLDDNLIDFKIPANPNSSGILRIECNFEYDEKDSNDIRPIAIILSEIEIN